MRDKIHNATLTLSISSVLLPSMPFAMNVAPLGDILLLLKQQHFSLYSDIFNFFYIS